MAQERKKRRIVLASILKPVDDARMFEKMGASLAQSGEYEVFIVGYPTTSDASAHGVQFISLPHFKRISFQRLAVKWQILKKVVSLRPSILIFNTHELLLPAIFAKILTNASLVYDVRENYFRNILLSGSFPWLIKWPLAVVVRCKEKLLAPAVDHFFLAEKGYENELKFHRGGWTVLENKAQPLLNPPQIHHRKMTKEIRLLFSGTLAESTGVFHAIQLAKELHRLDSSITLTIVGYSALEGEREKIHAEVRDCPFIQLTGINKLVPHHTLLEFIQSSDFGILSYPSSHHTSNSHPTKLFEYLSAQLPIILERHWPWISHYEINEPFVFFNFSNPDYPTLLRELKTKKFYPQPPEEVTWKSEETKLLRALNNL